MPRLRDCGVAIGRLRIVDRAGDPIRSRTGIEQQLSAASLAPRSLPPAAILIVRKLLDPLPGSLDPRAGLARAREWELAVESSLGGLALHAARPARERVPANAEAVLFLDQAELLACLARDLCEGTLERQWWWRFVLVRPEPLERQVVAAWRETPAAVPAAFEVLASLRAAARFAARLDRSQALELAEAVAEMHGLPTLSQQPIDAAVAAEEAATDPQRDARLTPPWRPYVAEAAPSLAAEQELLLGVALTLRRAPQVGRAPRFATEIRRWLKVVDSEMRIQASTRRRPSGRVKAHAPEPARKSGTAPRPTPKTTPLSTGRPSLAARRGAAKRLAKGALDEPARSADPERERPEPAERERPTVTRLGGVFFLVNVGIHLGLYGDFTAPRRAGIRLDIWDFVTVIARRLLGRVPTDPVWTLMAELAGREPAERPGHGFTPPRAWRMPPDWLEPFAADRHWRWDIGDGRLRVAHPAGFLVLDVDVGRDLGRELRRYGSPPIVRGPLGVDPPQLPALDRWAGWLAAYLGPRIALALGQPTRHAAFALLRLPARVHVTDTRVDVVAALEDLSVEVRLAGLDRDPGWVPAAGRLVAFHFE